MKTVSLFFFLLLFATLMVTPSCNHDEINRPGKQDTSGIVKPAGMTQQQFDANNEKFSHLETTSNPILGRSPITYVGEICGTFSGTNNYQGGIGNSALWSYYYFYGTAGDVVTFDGDRITCEMDMAFSVFQGTTTDNSGVTYYDGGPDMTWLAFGDDEQSPTCSTCFAFYDPYAVVVLPATGVYTVAVYDYIGCSGGPFSFTLNVSGITGPDCDGDGTLDRCDSDDDNDGVLDGDDAYPCSNTDATVNIDGCDSGVPNHVFADGSTFMDLILACANNASNHGQFVSCVSALTNAWKSAGLITGAQKGKIQACAANADLP